MNDEHSISVDRANPDGASAADRHAQWHGSFRWRVPTRFNIAEACCARWARERPQAVAIRAEREDGRVTLHRYAELQAAANRLSNVLRRLGVKAGDRVAVVMPQRVETAVAHMAVYQLGAVAMPLSMLFGPDALEYRLNDSEARVAIVDESAMANLLVVRAQCQHLKTVLAVGEAAGQGDVDWFAALAGEAATFTARKTHADDAAVLIYTSGTTGPPKGALIPHRALIGNLSGFVCSQNWLRGGRAAPKKKLGPGGAPADAVFWSPADWAWTGGLMDALLPALYFGVPIVAFQGRFGPERAFELMQRHRVTNTFLFPTALKAMMKAVPHPRERYAGLKLRAVMSAGEAVGDAVFNWCRDELGLTVNEMFGQTEINYVVGNCSQTMGTDGHPCIGWPARPGSMGRAYPGHRVAVIDDDGNECPRGTPGDVAVHRLDVHGAPDPVFFLGYWRRDDATRAKFTGDMGPSPGRPKKGAPPRGAGDVLGALGVAASSWCRTGDTALMDDEGYLWYQGRSDDVFKAAGYRIGPSEVENCLVKHPAVTNAAVVPKPDAERGALVKAYVVLAPGFTGSDALVADLQRHVRGQLAPYEYPKEIEFIDALPMTTTGKVLRRVLRLQEEQRARAAKA
ncbi:MAG TPA: AMP-binding protein [Ideonella sp.]|uniref:acyl-CoA synthetase n=1 Tax=Ideonella sp. TaxID=1929293 RepID=UPI002E36839E|nr:AMP-binding protein [Ideonella sp.]HEX5687147.1 AMP-binding protein [Ideonella sp.]